MRCDIHRCGACDSWSTLVIWYRCNFVGEVQHLYFQPGRATDQVDSKSTEIQTRREEVSWNTEEKNLSLISHKKLKRKWLMGHKSSFWLLEKLQKNLKRHSSCHDFYCHQVYWCVSQESPGSITTNAEYSTCYWFGTKNHFAQLVALLDELDGTSWIIMTS